LCDDGIKKDIKYIREFIEALQADKLRQWEFINDHTKKIEFFKGSLWVIVPVVTALLAHVIYSALTS
jgi:hypothetical protein